MRNELGEVYLLCIMNVNIMNCSRFYYLGICNYCNLDYVGGFIIGFRCILFFIYIRVINYYKYWLCNLYYVWKWLGFCLDIN